MSVRVVVDTNVLVYAQDADEPDKQRIALGLLDLLQSTGRATLTTQVLGEYYVTVTRKFRDTMPADVAAEQVRDLARAFQVLETTLPVVVEALRGVVRYRMSFYDAQVWAVARLNGIGVVLTEDFEDDRVIDGVRFRDPFVAGFDVEAMQE